MPALAPLHPTHIYPRLGSDAWAIGATPSTAPAREAVLASIEPHIEALPRANGSGSASATTATAGSPAKHAINAPRHELGAGNHHTVRHPRSSEAQDGFLLAAEERLPRLRQHRSLVTAILATPYLGGQRSR